MTTVNGIPAPRALIATAWPIAAESLPPMMKQKLMDSSDRASMRAGTSSSRRILRDDPKAAPGVRAIRCSLLPESPESWTTFRASSPSIPWTAPYTVPKPRVDAASPRMPYRLRFHTAVLPPDCITSAFAAIAVPAKSGDHRGRQGQRHDAPATYLNMSLTGTRHPGTTSSMASMSASVRTTASTSERCTFTVRLRGSTTITASVPAPSQSATFSSTSV